MPSEIQQNMKKLAQYRKIVERVYVGDDAKRFNELSRELQLCAADLFDGVNQHLFAELRKDVMTLGVGCISNFEDRFGYVWGNHLDKNELTDEQIDCLEEWQLARNEIFDRINHFLHKYQKLLLEDKNVDRK